MLIKDVLFLILAQFTESTIVNDLTVLVNVFVYWSVLEHLELIELFISLIE